MTRLPFVRALRSQPILIAAIGIVLLLLGGIAVAFARGIGGDDTTEAAIGDAPNFSIQPFDGSPFTLADSSDKPVFIYFWASWCEPCKTEAPLIQRLWPEYQAKGY